VGRLSWGVSGANRCWRGQFDAVWRHHDLGFARVTGEGAAQAGGAGGHWAGGPAALALLAAAAAVIEQRVRVSQTGTCSGCRPGPERCSWRYLAAPAAAAWQYRKTGNRNVRSTTSLRLDACKVQPQCSHWKLSLNEGSESVMCEILPSFHGEMLL
jgi:hypothetical protein